MRWTIVVVSSFAGTLVLQSPIQAQAPDSRLPVSIERIRAALQQPASPLQMPAPAGDTATFHIEVQERAFVFRPDDEKPFDPTFGLPSIGELLMDGIQKIGSSAVAYKRGRAERRARKAVADDLVAFCMARACPTSDVKK
jgi:hypothetical protein